MGNKQRKKIGIAVLFVCVFSFLFFLVDAREVFCSDESDNRTEQLEDKVADKKEGASTELSTTSELIELLKQRALLRIKKRKKERLFKVNVFASLAGGYEDNVNNDSTPKGDIFNSQMAMISWTPTISKRLGLNIGCFAFNQTYSEFNDSNYLYSSVSAAARMYTLSGGRLRLEPGVAYENIWYPLSVNSSYDGMKYFLKTKNFFSRNLSATLNFEFSTKAYNNRKARNPSGVKQTHVREDERYTLEAGIMKRVKIYSISLKTKAYRNTSNDLLQDLNDYYALKNTLSISGTFFEDGRLYVNFSPSFERKNYRERQAVFKARYDDRYSFKLSVYYTLSKNYTINYSVDYSQLDSNNTAAEYRDVTNQIGVSLKF